jgi:hypothetical protein
MFPVLLLLLFAVAGFFAWSTITALRSGAFLVRGGRQVSRSENPILFWAGISTRGGVSVLLLCATLWIAGQLWIHGLT